VLRHLATTSSLWLDREGVTFMDSSGLHALIAGQRWAALLGARIPQRRPPGNPSALKKAVDAPVA